MLQRSNDTEYSKKSIQTKIFGDKGSSQLIARQPIEKLSLKNIHISNIEMLEMNRAIASLKLIKPKLVYTPKYYEQTSNFAIFIVEYLKTLPHKNLKEVSFSLPKLDEQIDYLVSISNLTLEKLKIFIRSTPSIIPSTKSFHSYIWLLQT